MDCALFAVRIGLAASLDRNDLVRVIPLVLAVAVTYAVPTATPVKHYFLGAMFYSTFIMSMVLNYAAIATLLSKRTHNNRTLARPGILAVRIGMLLLLMGLFQMPVLAGAPRLATVFGTVAHDMRSSVDQLWSLNEQPRTGAAQNRQESARCPFLESAPRKSVGPAIVCNKVRHPCDLHW